MTNFQTKTQVHFHPVFLFTFLILPMFILIPIWHLSKIISAIYGQLLLFLLLIGIIAFTIKIFKYIIRLFSKKAVLILTETEVFDYQTGLTFQWKDIEKIEIGGYRTTFISITVLNSEKYISVIKNPLTRFAYRQKSKFFPIRFSFNVSLLKGKNEEILEALNVYLRNATD